MIFAAVAAEFCIVVAAASGCASGTHATGFGDSPAASSQAAAKPLGTYAASAGVTQKYGITEWRTYFGQNQMVVTGYRADGTAASGVQFAWFAPTAGSAGHTRLMMLDGSGAVLRRLVGGGEDGHLSNAQLALIQTLRSDIAMGQKPAVRKLREAKAGTYSKLDQAQSGPNMGPQCFEATTNPSTVLDASGCIVGAFTFETVVGGMMAMGSCAQWEIDNVNTNMTCNTENSQYCNNDTPPTCNYGQDTSTPAPSAPAAQCDQACICANYGVYNGMPCSTTCTDNNGCSSGQECHWGSCGPAATPPDSPTNQNVTQQTPGASSCGSGNMTPDPSTGQVGCSSPSGGAAGTTGGSSGSGSGGGSSTDTTGGDPATGSSGGASSSGSGGAGAGGQCADDGASCSQDTDCCLGACGGGTCGASAAGSSSGSGSGSSSGGGCAADGNACSQDSDCCAGSCDTSSGTCGSGSGSSSGGSSSGSGSSSGGGCSADGSACAQDSDCCGGSCDTSSGTCGSGSGSSSGGSGSSSGGGCSADGSSCAQNSDCCGGTCTAGTCGSGTTCGNPGDACAQDSDCCSGSCDTSGGTCN